MKKTLLLILCSLGLSFLHAQIKLDSVINVGESKTVFTYDEAGKVIESLEYQLGTATNQWILHERNTWGYVSTEMTHTTYVWNHALQQWSPLTRTVLDDSSEYLFETYEWNPGLGVWTGISREYALNTPFGQDYYIDSWNSTTLSWQNWIKTANQTGQTGNITEAISYRWLNNAWTLTANSVRRLLSYNSEGQILEEIYTKWKTSTSSWINQQKTTWEYNASGQTTDHALYIWEVDANEWRGILRSSHTYNTDTTSTIDYNWEENGSFWKPDQQRISTINADSSKATTQLFYFDTVLGDWFFERITGESLFTYTPEGKLSETITSGWRGEPFNALTYSTKTNYAYDEAGNIIHYALYNWNAFIESWYNVTQEIKAYDLTWDTAGLIYLPQFYSYLFEPGKLISFELYSLDPVGNNWHLEFNSYYYFSEFITATDEAPASEALKLFPNPVSNLLTPGANAPRASSYQITDLNGRVLQQEKTWNGDGIDVSRLIPGSYVIRLIEGNRVITGKFVKL